MSLPVIVWGSPEWRTIALGFAGLGALVVTASYARGSAARAVRLTSALLKLSAILALAVCLVEPLASGTRPRAGANLFAIVVDNSKSLSVRDQGQTASRGDWIKDQLQPYAPWRTRLARSFDERDFRFAARLEADQGFTGLTFNGTASALNGALAALSKRFRGLPLAGILLFTDGCRTDPGDIDLSGLPPIYPVPPPDRPASPDIGLRLAVASRSNFEAAPVTILAEAAASGFAGQTIVAVVRDEKGKILDRQTALAADGKTLSFRFQFRPENQGLSFVRVQIFCAGDEDQVTKGGEPDPGREQTLENNSRLLVVDQGGGPYRVLYVGGRPNWEYKFLRRALEEDDQVQLVGLVRIARRQPKFDFRAAGRDRSSPLFKGFDHPDPDAAERADEPVLVRLQTADEAELRDGFPKTAEDLFRYHAIVLDDLEASFFTTEQHALIRRFISERGGGFLMLGGLDSFVEGGYNRTPIGELLPFYLERRDPTPPPAEAEYRLALTREGWLEPWIRLRKIEDDERKRLNTLSSFRVLSQVGGLKPGVELLAEAVGPSDEKRPALAVQPFGKGRTGAILIGDLWRASLRRKESDDGGDFDRMWRQTIRWLVVDVPDRMEFKIEPPTSETPGSLILAVKLYDPLYRPLDNARASFRVTAPDGGTIALDAEADPAQPGRYIAAFTPRAPGAYRATATALEPDGSPIGDRQAGWAQEPAAEEFARLEPNRALLNDIAHRSGGILVDGDQLDSLVDELGSRPAPISEPWTSPLWHNALFFLAAILCLVGEWALRRTHGLP